MSDKLSSYIIEEKIGKTEVGFSEIIKLYDQRVLEKGEELFQDNDTINLDLNEKKKFQIKGVMKDLFYEDKMVNYPITVTFKKGEIQKTYYIYTQNYFDILYKEMDFKNPLLLIGNIYDKYDKDKISLFTHPLKNENNFIIIEKEEEKYEKYYTTKIGLLKELKGFDLTPNFKYYFSSPKSMTEMIFSISHKRKEAIRSIITFKNDKIHSIFGPYGNGKTTSLLILAKSQDNICYLNLKALYVNKDNLNIWKFDLFLLEIFNLFKGDEKMFKKIKEKILGSNHFWEAISLSITFCINNKIDSIFILDQYKEDIDPNFDNFTKLKEMVNNNSNNFVKLVISSSINNKDIRNFIIQKYIHKLSKQNLVNDYLYIPILFQLKDIEGLIDKLSNTKRKIYEEYFSNIPSYFYIIYESDEDEINQTVANIKKRIKDNILKFFKNNDLSQENFCFIIRNYPKIEIYSKEDNKKNNKVKLDSKYIKRFIEILPIKYFFLDIQDEEIVNILFYFKLAKICFLEIILNRIFKFLEQPKLQIPERAIGDLLESIVIENLKDNSIENFDQICKVDSIWDMTYANEIDKKKVKNNNILIIQDNEEAKFIDFGFLLKGKTLILVQCKKSLIIKPKEYVKIKDIILAKNTIFNSFQQYFDCEIEKIKLIYLTGIYFIDEKNNKYQSWSFKDTSFKVLESITIEENIPLAFFDVQNKKILIKSYGNTFDCCSITNDDSLLYKEDEYTFVEININEKDLIKVFEGMKNHLENQGINLIQHSKYEEKSENKTDCEIYKQSLNRDIIPNKRIVVNTPDASFISNGDENILTTFKINNMKCFSYYDNNIQAMRYKEIKKGEATDLEMKDIKIYFLQKKTNPNNK